MHVYALFSAFGVMALLNTLKLTLTGRVTPLRGVALRVVFHPAWLTPLAVMVPLVIGYYTSGKLSPWPIAAFATGQAAAGLWGGVLAAISTLTVDFWMFWTTAAALLTFTTPLATHYPTIHPSLHKYFYLTNVLAGCLVVWANIYKHAF